MAALQLSSPASRLGPLLTLADMGCTLHPATMWLRRFRLVAFFCLLAPACTTTIVEKRKAEPGYSCSLEKRGDFGLISANFELSLSAGWRNHFLNWDAGDGEFANPWITAAWFRTADGRFEMDNGYVSIMRHITVPKARALDLKLHLRTIAGAPRFKGSVISSDYQRSAGPYHLNADWSEVAALARGAPRLHLVAMDRKHKVVDDTVIDSAIFAKATPSIQAAMRDLEAMMNNPSGTCTFVDDLGTDDIVLT